MALKGNAPWLKGLQLYKRLLNSYSVKLLPSVASELITNFVAIFHPVGAHNRDFFAVQLQMGETGEPLKRQL